MPLQVSKSFKTQGWGMGVLHYAPTRVEEAAFTLRLDMKFIWFHLEASRLVAERLGVLPSSKYSQPYRVAG